ncbi:hypothetical protein [Acidisoma sp. 7E03]
MSDLPPLRLRTYRPNWEELWEAANARHLAAQAATLAPYADWLPKQRKINLIEELQSTGEELCRMFEAQFKTTDDYAAWRLKWLSNELKWTPALPLEMPRGLPIIEIRRRLQAARESWPGNDFETPQDRDFRRQVRVHSILSEPPNVGIASLAYALSRMGGDHV